MTESN